MKLPKVSIAVSVVGLFVIISSTIRWFFLHPDFSQLIIFDSIGCLIIILAYIYLWMKDVDERIDTVRTQADAIASKVFGLEYETIEELARRGKV